MKVEIEYYLAVNILGQSQEISEPLHMQLLQVQSNALLQLQRAIESQDPAQRDFQHCQLRVTEKFPEESIHSKWQQDTQMGEIVQHVNATWTKINPHISVIQKLTEYTTQVADEGNFTPLLPDALLQRIRQEPEEQRQNFLASWCTPKKYNDPIKPSLIIKLGEHTLRGKVQMAISPLTFDIQTQQAAYFIDIGLQWEGSARVLNNWDDRQLSLIWKAIQKGIEAQIYYYRERELPPDVESFEFELSDVSMDLSPSNETEETSVVVKEGEGEPERNPLLGIAFGNTVASAQAYAMIHVAHEIKLPRVLGKIRPWKKIADEEIQSILEKYGAKAYEEERDQHGRIVRKALLRTRKLPGGNEEAELTKTAENEIKWRHGRHGFMRFDKMGHERLYKIIPLGNGGSIEIGLSWQGLAGPLVQEWVEEIKQMTNQVRDPLLYEHLDERRKQMLEDNLNRIHMWENGRRVMHMLLGQIGRQGQNPVEIPAEAFKVLLWPDENYLPLNWKTRVDGILTALNTITFSYETFKTQKVKSYGSFLSQWKYHGRGKGGHGEGIYVLQLQTDFIGCLDLFTNSKSVLRTGHEAVNYYFKKKLSKEERDKFGWGAHQKAKDYFISFDAGNSFYHQAAKLTPLQENIMNWVELNLTREDNSERMLKFGHNFCPCLPTDSIFYCALGNFQHNPHKGFTLLGSKGRGERQGGLMHLVDYNIRPVRGYTLSTAIVNFLDDLKSVVIDYLGGAIYGKFYHRWLEIDTIKKLLFDEQAHEVKIFIFVPPDWNERRRRQWEQVTGRKVTEDLEVARHAAWENIELPFIETSEQKEKPQVQIDEADLNLLQKLWSTMKSRGLKQSEIAEILGVGKSFISQLFKKNKKLSEPMKEKIIKWLESETHCEKGE